MEIFQTICSLFGSFSLSRLVSLMLWSIRFCIFPIFILFVLIGLAPPLFPQPLCLGDERGSKMVRPFDVAGQAQRRQIGSHCAVLLIYLPLCVCVFFISLDWITYLIKRPGPGCALCSWLPTGWKGWQKLASFPTGYGATLKQKKQNWMKKGNKHESVSRKR